MKLDSIFFFTQATYLLQMNTYSFILGLCTVVLKVTEVQLLQLICGVNCNRQRG